MDKIEKRHLLTTHVAGFGFWDGAEVFEELRIGTVLRMVREEDNKFDPYAVALGFSPHLPVSVCGTGAFSIPHTFSRCRSVVLPY